jgi:hypothetical protein
MSELHLISTAQHTVPGDGGGLIPTGYWHLSCTCGWDANSIPTNDVEKVRQEHESGQS